MAILRDSDPNVGCLAVPIASIGGFITAAMLSASVGAGPGLAGAVGLGGSATGSIVAWIVLKRLS